MILTNSYPPEVSAGANQLFELAQALTSSGHSVSVVSRFPRRLPKEQRPIFGWRLIIREKCPEAHVVRVKVPELSRRIPLLREIEHVLNFFLLIVACLISGKSEVILVYSPPIISAYAALVVRFFYRNKIVLNVQDLFPQSLIDLGLLKNRFLIALSRVIERLLYKRVDHITVMSEMNREIVGKTAGNLDKIQVVYNWVDTDYIRPGDRLNEFRREFGLGEKFALTFAGCIADSQDMDIILNSAKKLEEEKGLIFLLVGNGPRYEDTITKTKAMGLKNVLIMPIQPREKYVKLLAASDVGLITLNSAVATPVVPSKMLSIMSAGRAILASLPLFGDAPEFIEKAGSGIVVSAGDTEAFYRAVLKLFNDRKLCREYGASGRAWVVVNYSLDVCARKYEKLFAEVIKDGIK
ncbi:glycosyltransferase family 4 protein [Candidatus Saganbacteria bacterium]|nr:glycosyltransferase family 4 protein [Candidatus Saganbacteria bacterium]